jgi:probable F420-dependent oxidoreductase
MAATEGAPPTPTLPVMLSASRCQTPSVKFTVEYPIGSPGFDARFLDPATMSSFVSALEDAGIDAVAFTEHPAPSKKWLDAGGHASLDPLTALAFCAATTSRIRLMTYLLVLPFRNPLLCAKQVATADVLSAGRVTVVTGTGYLRSEFAALGVDFEERNELFDEALAVLRSVWTEDSFASVGLHFKALGQASVPAPVQRPHPPLWVGGNSRIARRRVATSGEGWAPLIIGAEQSKTTRTPAIENVADLRTAIADLRQLTEQAGRDPAGIDIQVQWRELAVDGDPDHILRLLEQLAEVGVTWVVLNPPNSDVDRCLDALATYADRVISQAR